MKFLLEKGNRSFVKKLDSDFFMLKNCSEIYEMLKADNKISVAEIQSKLDGEKAKWFSKIAFDNSLKLKNLIALKLKLLHDLMLRNKINIYADI